MSFENVPKADMHVHLEATISPELAVIMAERNGLEIPPGLIENGAFTWKGDGTAEGNLKAFLDSYDAVTRLMKTAQDYTDVTHDCLIRWAKQNCIYMEATISADHGAMLGLTYPQMIEAIEEGYKRANAETGIEMRAISTAVRHFGPESALKVGQITGANPHPLVTGFGLAGAESMYKAEDFRAAFDAAGKLHRTAHAGETMGPQSVRDARDILKVERFGHMVRAIEDPALMEELVAARAAPEVCVTSNMLIRVFNTYAEHPLRGFFDAGMRVTLGSDDPSFFKTDIGREYEIAQKEFGFTDKELTQVTRNAIEAAFVDEPTRHKLLARLKP
jgi:adenosine deaminase